MFTDKGGDTVQVINTAKYLEELGVAVDIHLTTDKIDYTQYDLIHFFNIIRPADILRHINKSDKAFVVSTIFVDYSEYEKKERGGFTGLASKIFSSDTLEYFKTLARLLIKNDKIISPSYLFMGQRKSIKRIMRQAAVLLPNSESEYRRLSVKYKVKCNYKAIPNAIDPLLFQQNFCSFQKDPMLIICVGRIEGRKNQLKLIQALNNTKYRLIIIGAHSPNHAKYYALCKQIAANNVSFVESISQQKLVDYYHKAKVHVLPSWFETTGLSTLEAAAMRCNIVITDKGDTREYFEDYAFYCDPESEQSILNAVERAAAADFNERLHAKIYREYTWVQTAKKTLSAYAEVLSPD